MYRKLIVVLIALMAILASGVVPALAHNHHPTPTPEHPTPTPVIHPTETPTSTPVPPTSAPPTEVPPTDPPPPPPTEPPLPPTIADIVVSSATGSPPQFVTLLAAVQAADPGILAALADRSARLTVFAPTDEAFALTLRNLGISAEQLLADRAQLTRILQYHVVPGVFSAGGLANIATLPNNRFGTLTNASLQFTNDSGLRVNNIPIIAADINAANGVIHVISEVLIPPVYVEPTIAEIVVNSTQANPPQFVTLLAAVQAADPSILAALSDRDASLTVFAPTDAAFADLLSALNVTAEELLGNTPLLNEVLRYHVVPGEYTAAELRTFAEQGTVQFTLQGDRLTFNLDGNGNLRINSSDIVAADVFAVNGIIHIIDEVLLPPDRPSIADIVIESAAGDPPQFTVLLAAVQAADPSILEALADDDGSLTIFAPTDEAFAQLLSDLSVTAEELLANTALLNDVLRYHVLPGEKTAAFLIDRANSSNPVDTTLLGEDVNLEIRDGSLFVNESRVIQVDIEATNGLVHVIDAVLLPPS